MNILYCGDTGVCDGIALSVLSICKHVREPLSIYLLTASLDGREAIPSAFADMLQKEIGQTCPENRVHLLDISDLFGSYLPTANMGTRFTPYCMLRLFADLVKEIPDRILYLDTDVLCRADFREMYGTDLSQSEIVGVPDRYGKWFFGNIFRHDYLNSGVLLLNMARIRESGLFRRCRTMCRDKKMFMPDQSALNKLAVKRKMPKRYNEQGKIRKDTVFKHFTTFFKLFPYVRAVTVKPWHTEQMHEMLGIFEFDDITEAYRRIKENAKRNPDFLHH